MSSEIKNQAFNRFMGASIVLGLMSVVAPRLFGDIGVRLLLTVLDAAWLAVLIAAFLQLGRRAYWLFLTAPLILSWPIAFWILARACDHNSSACP